jgi:G3E family GTPase
MTRARLDSVVTIVDSDAFLSIVSTCLPDILSMCSAASWSAEKIELLKQTWSPTACSQLTNADVILMNKTDLLVCVSGSCWNAS